MQMLLSKLYGILEKSKLYGIFKKEFKHIKEFPFAFVFCVLICGVILAVIIGYEIIGFEENAYKKQLADMTDTIKLKDATIQKEETTTKEALMRLDFAKDEIEKLRI